MEKLTRRQEDALNFIKTFYNFQLNINNYQQILNFTV